MQVWLVENQNLDGSSKLEGLLRQMEKTPGSGLRLVGVSRFQSEPGLTLRTCLPDPLDVLVINEPNWLEEPGAQEVFGLELAMIVISTAKAAEHLRPLATQYPVTFVSPTLDEDGMCLALKTALTGQQRETHWKDKVARLQQRLSDRILIERAKGVLVQLLKISEEDAYKRLRLQSRRQRRQIRDIAQWVLDTHSLYAPGSNGFGEFLKEEPEREPETHAEPGS
jgi:AmiR/NasT family two-component response regulator